MRRPRRPGARRHRLRAISVTGALLAAVAVPAPAAHAHGLVERGNLPLPEWLFAWVATGVMVISFAALAAAWPRPKLEPVPWRALPEALSRVICSRPLRALAGATGAGLLALVIAAGYLGPETPTGNFAPTFVLIIFWVGLAFASAILGDVFRALNPWRAIAAAAGRSGRALGLHHTPRAYPERLGMWPAAAGLLAFTWLELASGWGEQPDRLATAVLVYTVVTLGAMWHFGAAPWLRDGEAFSVYFGLFARLAPFEVRDGRLGVRPPLAGLAGLHRRPGLVAVLVTMIGTVTFDGLSQGDAWTSVAVTLNEAWLSLGLDIETAVAVTATIGLLAAVAIVALFYRLGMEGVRSIGAHLDTGALGRAFAHALVPIAMAYVAAHYLTFLLFEGQAIGYLASDPLGRGWDLFGSASASIDFGLIGQATAWYLQVAVVVLGHVGALALAHDRALVLFGDARVAVRSQYWMLAVMVGFTTLALWLLAQAG